MQQRTNPSRSRPDVLVGTRETSRLTGLRPTLRNRPARSLSGGEAQRVAVARALINSPKIILADEPTGNLDSKTSIDIMGLLDEIHKKGNTVIVVTHEEDIARHAARIIKLIDGEVSSDVQNEKYKKF